MFAFHCLEPVLHGDGVPESMPITMSAYTGPSSASNSPAATAAARNRVSRSSGSVSSLVAPVGRYESSENSSKMRLRVQSASRGSSSSRLRAKSTSASMLA